MLKIWVQKLKHVKLENLKLNGKVESPNRFVAWLIPYNYEFEDEKELIDIVNVQLTHDVNNQKHADLNIEPIMLFEKEKSSLLPLPTNNIIEKYLENYQKVKVTNESLIRYKGKAFSVKPEYVNCYVSIEECNESLYIYYQNNLIDIFDLNRYSNSINYKPEHYSRALAISIGKNVQPEDIEKKARENLNKLSMIGGIVNDLQQVNK